MRFHQAVTFLPIDEVVEPLRAADTLGYSGIYLSDHLFNPRELESKYTYSKAPDGVARSGRRRPPGPTPCASSPRCRGSRAR